MAPFWTGHGGQFALQGHHLGPDVGPDLVQDAPGHSAPADLPLEVLRVGPNLKILGSRGILVIWAPPNPKS